MLFLNFFLLFVLSKLSQAWMVPTSVTTMEKPGVCVDVHRGLAERATRAYETRKNNCHQVFICIAGGPGSGKSTLAETVSGCINEMHGESISVVLPMDGYHYSRNELRELGNQGRVIGDPASTTGKTTSYENLLSRRGSPWTFDPFSLYQDFSDAKKHGVGSLPIYSRAMSDPVPDGVQLNRDHKIVICEGNYLLAFDQPEWRPLDELWDEKWFLSVSEDVILGRLIKRHLETWTDEKARMWGPGEIGAKRKAEANDLKNAIWIEKVSRKYADLIIS